MVAEHQLLGVRFEVHLTSQVGHSVNADVMTDQGDRHDERNELAPIVLDGGSSSAFESRRAGP